MRPPRWRCPGAPGPGAPGCSPASCVRRRCTFGHCGRHKGQGARGTRVFPCLMRATSMYIRALRQAQGTGGQGHQGVPMPHACDVDVHSGTAAGTRDRGPGAPGCSHASRVRRRCTFGHCGRHKGQGARGTRVFPSLHACDVDVHSGTAGRHKGQGARGTRVFPLPHACDVDVHSGTAAGTRGRGGGRGGHAKYCVSVVCTFLALRHT